MGIYNGILDVSNYTLLQQIQAIIWRSVHMTIYLLINNENHNEI
jgi:hypothetical protein